jgi:hypothetical protein
MSGGNRLTSWLDDLADLLEVPYCARCGRPMWFPPTIVTWLGSKYHFFCWRRTYSERPTG